MFLLWLGTEVFYARMIDNSVLVSTLNYPRIHELAEETRQALSLRRQISIFVYEHGFFNAGLVRLFRRRAIFLNSEVLETGVSDNEVRWIVGRFVGYLRVQQDTGIIGLMVHIAERSGIFTLLIFPYSRAMVYTGDRLGLAAIAGDIGSAVSAMQKLLVGRKLGYSVNPAGLVEQRRETKGSLFAFLARVGSPFPSTLARYVDLINFARRQFPEPYRLFEAATPGLPAELDDLSGERTSGRSIAKGIGFYLAIGVAFFITVLAWMGLMVGMGAMAPKPSYDDVVDVPAIVPDPADQMTNADEPVADPYSDAPASNMSSAIPAGGDGHLIANPDFAAGPSAADIASAYPAMARANGVTGTGTIRCHVQADGSVYACEALQEAPVGSGFASAALQTAGQIRLTATDRDGVAVGGGIVGITVTFGG
jgi:hypothetical protein